MNSVDDATILEKLTGCGTSVRFSCGAFFLSAALFVPITAALFNRLGFPEWLTKMTILAELVGLPIIAAIVSISLAARSIARRSFERMSIEV